jgi:hypothetical protein
LLVRCSSAGALVVDEQGPRLCEVLGGHVNPDVAEYDTGKVATIVDGDHRFHRASDEVKDSGPE